MFLTCSLFTSELLAQESKASKKELRKRQRYEAEAAQQVALKEFLTTKDFGFNATEIESTGHASISNIRLNSLWYINVKPNMIKCYLPIYGTASPTSRPTVLRKMDFTSTNYEYELKEIDGGYKGYSLKIETRDTRSNTTYTFEFDIPANGLNVRVRINSTYNAPISFKGNILN